MTRTVLRLRRWSALCVAVAASVLQACGASDSTSVKSTVTLTLNPPSASVRQGGSTTLQAQALDADGVNDVVGFQVSGLPTGVTWLLSDVQISGSVASAKVTFNVAASLTTGMYSIGVQALRQNLSPVTTNFLLAIAEAPPSPVTIRNDYVGSVLLDPGGTIQPSQTITLFATGPITVRLWNCGGVGGCKMDPHILTPGRSYRIITHPSGPAANITIVEQ
jgi:hypothetical protein